MHKKLLGLICLVVTVAGFCLPRDAKAADHTIIQKDKSFVVNDVTIDDISIKAGDSLTFINNDVVTHNIYAKNTVNEFEIPKQEPGITASVVMKTPGEVNIRCAIHPKMKLHVTVQAPAGP